MKRALMLFLLLSVGLNIGLGFALKRSRDDVYGAPRWPEGGRFQGAAYPDSQWPGHTGRFDRERMHRMREWHETLTPELTERRASLQEARAVLHAALRRDDVDEGEIMTLVSGMIAAQGGIDSLIVSNLLRELEKMPPEDREEILRRLERPLGGPFGGRGRGRGRGLPPVSP